LLVRAESGNDRGIDSPADTLAVVTTGISADRLVKLKRLANRFCRHMTKDTEAFVKATTKQVKKFMVKNDNATDLSGDKILEFLNENGKYMFCDLPRGGEQHYLVYAENNQFDSKVFGDFLDKLSTTIAPNINFIVRRNPGEEPETYLDILLKKANNMISSKSLRDSYHSLADRCIYKYGAKTWKELLTKHPADN
jgi:hypothetical protein